MTLPLALLATAFLLVLANGLSVAAESGHTTAGPPEAERATRQAPRSARHVTVAQRGQALPLSGTRLAITLTSLAVGMLAEPALAHFLRGPLTGAGLPVGAVAPLAVLAGVLLASAAQMVVGELVPRGWALSRPWTLARCAARPQRLISAALRPLRRPLDAAAQRTVRALGVRPVAANAAARGPGELVCLARQSARAGALEQDTADLFVRTLSLGGLTAQHVMTPRLRVSALQSGATAQDVLNLTRATGLSRFPVYRDRLDEITGMVHLKDALAVPASDRLRTPAGSVAVPPLLVPGSLPLQPLLERLRNEQPIAVVVDEYGGTAGVVTLEDIVEELVGEVRDEHDGDALRPLLVPAPPEPDGSPAWEADGACRIDALPSIGLHAPQGPYETVAGLVAGTLGRIPVPGDTAALPVRDGQLPAGTWEVRVRLVRHHRAERVRIVRTAAASRNSRPPGPSRTPDPRPPTVSRAGAVTR